MNYMININGRKFPKNFCDGIFSFFYLNKFLSFDRRILENFGVRLTDFSLLREKKDMLKNSVSNTKK